jgi:transcriptional regulator with XRE-family HTH domain
MLAITDLVKRIREANGDTQEGLARRLGLSYPTINAWERGRSAPTPRHRAKLESLAKDLGIVSELIVLVIDDDPNTALVVESVAADVDTAVSVSWKSTGWEGLLMCGALVPDILFVEPMLLGASGASIARSLASVDRLHRMRVVSLVAATTLDQEPQQTVTYREMIVRPVQSSDVHAIISESLPAAVARR